MALLQTLMGKGTVRMANGITTDVVVIGSGITATAIAFALSRRGVRNLLLLEQRTVNTGATGRAFGLVHTYHAVREMTSLARRSLRFYERFHQQTQRHGELVRAGLLVLAPTGEQETLERRVQDANRRGNSLQLLHTGAAVQDIEPRLALTGIAASAYEEAALFGNPVQVSAEFVNAARLEGTKLLEGIHILRIDTEGNEGNRSIVGLLTDGGYVHTRYIVNAGGAWVNELNTMIGVHMPISPFRYVGLMLRHPPTFGGPPLPIVFDLASGTVLRPNGPGQTLMGPLVAAAADLVVPGAEAPPPDRADEKEYMRFLQRRFPSLNTARMSGFWTATHDVTPDGLPMIGAVPDVGGYYCAVGMGGHSFCLAPAVGELVARLIIDKRTNSSGLNVPPNFPGLDVRSHAHTFRPERFRLTPPGQQDHAVGAADG